MRTNLVDGLIVGLAISAVVLVARWLFDDALVLGQGAVILLGAALLVGLQVALGRLRERAAPAPAPEPAQPAEPGDAPAPLSSPRTPWAAPANLGAASPPAEPAAQAPAAEPPAADATRPAEGAPTEDASARETVV